MTNAEEAKKKAKKLIRKGLSAREDGFFSESIKKWEEVVKIYEDLGMKSRTEMGKFMSQHFPTLASLKPKDKLWKKFLYDSIGKIAPACAACDDQITCFACIIKEQIA